MLCYMYMFGSSGSESEDGDSDVDISLSEGESETGEIDESEVEDSAEPDEGVTTWTVLPLGLRLNFPKKLKNSIVSSFCLMMISLNTSLQKQVFMHNRNFRETHKGLRSGNQ